MAPGLGREVPIPEEPRRPTPHPPVPLDLLTHKNMGVSPASVRQETLQIELYQQG